MSSIRKIVLGSREVTIEFERKRVRNINVRVRRDGTLYCSLPYYVAEKEAVAFIFSKQDYLLKSLDSMATEEQTKSLSRSYVDGGGLLCVWKALYSSRYPGREKHLPP